MRSATRGWFGDGGGGAAAMDPVTDEMMGTGFMSSSSSFTE